jgi:hypothetical protein
MFHPSQRKCGVVLTCLLLFVSVTLLMSRAANADTQPLDVVVLVDSSGSMLLTDPLSLRKEGVRLFVELLEGTDRVALMSFDSKPTLKVPLAGKLEKEKTVTDPMVNAIAALPTKGEYTDIGLAVEAASELLATTGRANAIKSIILLSDGRFDPMPDRGNVESLVKELTETTLAKIADKGVRVYSLAFSSQADIGLLEKIAQKTGGFFWFTPTAEKIHESFADLLLIAKKPQVLSFDEQGFYVDELVEEATFYIAKDSGMPVSLLSPDESRYTNSSNEETIRWYSSRKFEVITIFDPLAGNWKISGANLEEGYATLLTKLTLRSTWPTAITVDDPTLLEVQLYDNEKPLALSSMSALINCSFQIVSSDVISEPILDAELRDDGKHGDKKSGDGVFSAYVALPNIGRYRLKVFAKSPTFSREQILPFQVESPFLTLEALDSESFEGLGLSELKHKKKEDGHGSHKKPDVHAESNSHANNSSHASNWFVVKINQTNEKISDAAVTVIAQKNGKKDKMTFRAVAAKEPSYFFVSDEILKSGTYQVYAVLKAKKNSKNKLLKKSNSILFKKNKVESLHKKPEEEKKVEAEVKPEVIEPSDKPNNSVLSELIAVSILIFLGFSACAFKLLRSGIKKSDQITIPALPNDFSQIMAEIERTASLSEIDLSDPRFKSDPDSQEESYHDSLRTDQNATSLELRNEE